MHRRTLLRALPALLLAPALPLAALRPAAAAAAAEDGPLRMRDLYEKDMSFSELALSLEGERVSVQGFMAPPLKAKIDFFVLTKRPMAVCPFCEDEADWPRDILAVHTKRDVRPIPFNVGIETSGRLELGAERDEETGFVSRVRLVDARYARA